MARYPGKKIQHVGTREKKRRGGGGRGNKKKKEKKEERKKFNFPRLVRRIVSISMGGGKNWGYLNWGWRYFIHGGGVIKRKFCLAPHYNVDLRANIFIIVTRRMHPGHNKPIWISNFEREEREPSGGCRFHAALLLPRYFVSNANGFSIFGPRHFHDWPWKI